MMAERAMRVLIVDDNAQYREAFARMLRLEGCEVSGAPDADEALQCLQAADPDVVVTDLQMRTEREGLDLIEMVKAADPLLPVIMISGVGSFEEGAMASRLGAAHVIHKSRIEEEMEGFLATIRQSQAAARKSRGQLAQVAQARVAAAGEEGARIAAVKQLLADPKVDPYVKGEAYDFISTLGDPELLRESESTMEAAAASDRYDELRRMVEGRLRKEIPGYDALDSEGSRALTTAEYLFVAEDEDDTPDFSRSAAFSYSLAVECEARARLKGKMTRLSNDTRNRRVLEACMDQKGGRVDVNFQQALMLATRRRRIHFTIANVNYVLVGLLSKNGPFKADGLKDVGIVLLCFARDYSFSRWGQVIRVNNPLRVRGLQSDDEVITLAGHLIALQYARNPYVHPDTGKRERLANLRGTALACLNELIKLR